MRLSDLTIMDLKKYKYPNLMAEVKETTYSICTIAEHMGLENQNQENNTAAQTGNGNQQQEKTFTQEEVNRIVQDRLARVKAAGSMDQREAALQERENALYAREAVEAAGLTKELAEELRGMDKATVDKVIKIVTPYARKASEPIYNAVGPTMGSDLGIDAIRAAMGLKR